MTLIRPTVSDLAPSLIRTAVPIIVGAVGGYGATYLHLTTAQQTEVVSAGVGYAYYALVRVLEHRWPVLGVFLGVPQAPVYPRDLSATIEAAARTAAEAAVAAAVARQAASQVAAPTAAPAGAPAASSAVPAVAPGPPTASVSWADLVTPAEAPTRR